MFDFFESLGQRILDGIGNASQWFGSLSVGFFEGLKGFITTLFSPLILLVEGIWYLISNLFDIVVLVIQVIIGLFYVLTGVTGGIFITFGQLMSFTGSTNNYILPSEYQQGLSFFTDFMSQSGLNNIAYIMAVFVWLLTAYAVIRIASGDR